MEESGDENIKYTPFLRYRWNITPRTSGSDTKKPRSISNRHLRNTTTSGKETPSVRREPPSPLADYQSKSLAQLPRVPNPSLYAIGGVHDPFECLPANPHVPDVGNVLNFILSIWCSTRPNAQSVNSMIPALVSEVMKKESLVKALVAYGQAYHECVHKKQVQPSASFLARLGPLLEHLRSLLIAPDPDFIDEAIILIYTLIGIGRLTGVQARETNLHFEGMGRLIRLRGGVNKLGMNGAAKAAVTAQQFFSLFSTSSSASISHPLLSTIPTDFPTVSFTEPANLTAPDVVEKIRALPYGISSFALSVSLSQGMIETAFSFQKWLKAPRNTDGDTILLETIYRAHTALSALLDEAEGGPSTGDRRPCQDLYLERVICLTLEVIAAEVFYGTQIHAIAPKLAIRMTELASSQSWSLNSNVHAHDADVTLPKKCMAWALMAAAEAADPCPGGVAASVMASIFDMQVLDVEELAEPNHSTQNTSETAWRSFHQRVLKNFFCPGFLVKSWKRCFMKHWRCSEDQKRAT